MVFPFRNSGFINEVTFVMITMPIFIFEGISRTYMVFLFEQLKQPGSPIVLDKEQESWIASAFGLGSPIGCLLSGRVMDIFGRKMYFFVMYTPVIISWAIITFAQNYEMLLYGTILQGFGIGMSFCGTTYIAEISTTRNRGAYLGLIEVAYCFGIVMCNVSMYLIRWNIVALLHTICAIICTLLLLRLTESPTWLYAKGKTEESIKALSSLRCSHPDDIKDEIEDMKKASDNLIHTSIGKTIRNVFRAWKPLAMIILMKILLQNSGYAVMSAYTIKVFKALELPVDSSKFVIEYSVAGLVGSIGTALFMHTMNRKTVLFSTSLVMGICMMIIGTYTEIFYFHKDKIWPYIIPLAFYLNTFACNLGADPIIYCLGGELFPSEVRGTLNGIYGAADNLYTFASLKLFPAFMEAVGIRFVLWTFTFFSFVVVAYGIYILPETKGRTLNEVQEEYFQKKKTSTEMRNEQYA